MNRHTKQLIINRINTLWPGKMLHDRGGFDSSMNKKQEQETQKKEIQKIAELTEKQKKEIDKNNNGVIEEEDFEILRKGEEESKEQKTASDVIGFWWDKVASEATATKQTRSRDEIIAERFENKLASLLQEKEARAGHPANVELARMVRPGIFAGLNEGSPVKFENELSRKLFEGKIGDTAEAFRTQKVASDKVTSLLERTRKNRGRKEIEAWEKGKQGWMTAKSKSNKIFDQGIKHEDNVEEARERLLEARRVKKGY